MSDGVKLPRELAVRTKPRFIETKSKRPQVAEDCSALPAIAARTEPRFVVIPRERRGGRLPRNSSPPWALG
jgi:hypothetical protein